MVDTTVVHTTCASYRAKELAAIVKRNLAAESYMLPKVWTVDPTLLEREGEKAAKYNRLLMVTAALGWQTFFSSCLFLTPGDVDLQ